MWMSKWDTITLHHLITVNNDVFANMDVVMRALAKQKTQWNKDLCFAVKVAPMNRSWYCANVTPTTGLLDDSAEILDCFGRLQSFSKWDKAMDVNPEDEASYTTQYLEAFLTYVEN